MEYTQLGNTGLRVSKLSIGTLFFGNTERSIGQKEVNAIVDAMYDEGVNVVDTARLYNAGASEETLGEALKGRRDRMIIMTKGGHEGQKYDDPDKGNPSARMLKREVELSLKALKTDYIDVYMWHNGGGDLAHPPIFPMNTEECMRAMDDMVREGKVRYLAGSNTSSWNHCYANQLAERHGWSKLVLEQSGYSMMSRKAESEMLEYCKAFDISYMPFFPLSAGFLTGKYKKGEEFPADSRAATVAWCGGHIGSQTNENNFALLDKLVAFARERDRSVAELAIAWLLKHPAVDTVPVGATRPEHVKMNAKAVDWILTDDEYAELNAILKEHGK